MRGKPFGTRFGMIAEKSGPWGRAPDKPRQFKIAHYKHGYYVSGMENFAFEVVETARLIRREANRRSAVLGATKAQWRVLARLSRAGDGVRQIELADALDVEPITLCRMIDRLEEAGLVERRRDDHDRRAWRIYLTELAGPVLVKLEAMGIAFNADILAGISPSDRETALRVLARIRHNLDQVEELGKAS